MPVGMQLMAPAGRDEVLLNAAAAVTGEGPQPVAPL
jgi:Asp-tRNA(Asn)/Glu-tRNA(Gln) amidotransferase A subunit family amidase